MSWSQYHTEEQTPSINHGPDGTCSFPSTHHLPLTASSKPDLSKTHPKYLKSDTCFICIPSMWTSHFNPSSLFNTTLLLSALAFKALFLHTPTTHPTIAVRSFSDLPHKTKSSAYKRPDNLYSILSSRNLSSSPYPLLLLSSLHPYTHWRAKERQCNLVSHHCQFWNTHSHPLLLRHRLDYEHTFS